MGAKKKTRDQSMREHAAKLLGNQKVSGVIGVRKTARGAAPHLFKDVAELETLTHTPRYAMATLCRKLQKLYPEEKFAVLARGCDERAMHELVKREQLDMKRLVILGLACTSEEAEDCHCEHPYPETIHVGRACKGVSSGQTSRIPDDLTARLKYWQREFSKCLKCYGCRNVCPVCFCEDCVLEESLWVKTGTLPPATLPFHLTRAYHVADKCIDCGECEAACPAGIPLRSICKAVKGEMKALFDFEPGADAQHPSPLITSLEANPVKEEE